MKRWWPVPLVTAAALAVYLYTLSPAVGLIDSGELATGCRLLGILHPTGYPLYTMLGRLASLVPVAAVVNRVAALSALLAAAGCGVFCLLLLRLGVSRLVAVAVALAMGLSYPVWSVAVDVEVYSLTFLLLGLLWLAAERAEQGRELPLFAFLCGLALTNHMSAASAVLGAGVCLLLSNRLDFRRLVPALLLLFGLGLSPYLFLVLRARAEPLFAWGNPYSLERLWWHVTGKQYQVWMFSTPLDQVLRNAGRGAALLSRALLYVLVPAALYGAVRLWRQRRGLCIGFCVSALACFAYAVNYSIPDIDAYYIPCLVALGVLAAVGLEAAAARFRRWQVALLVLPLAALALNFGPGGKRGDFVAVDAAENTLASARPGSTIITDFWDFYSPAFYLQHIESERPDLCIIDKELLRRSWYFKYLARQYPWLVERSKPEIDAYLGYLDQFEHRTLRDPMGIQRAFITMIASFVERNPERAAYTTFAADADADARQLLPGMARAPVGLLFELRSDTLLPEFDFHAWRIRLPLHQFDLRTRMCLERYRYFIGQKATALAQRGRTAEADSLVAWYRAQPLDRLVPVSLR